MSKGPSLVIQARWEPDVGKLPGHATALVDAKVDAIVTFTTPATRAAHGRHPVDPDRLHDGERPGGQRVRREPGEAGGTRHRRHERLSRPQRQAPGARAHGRAESRARRGAPESGQPRQAPRSRAARARGPADPRDAPALRGQEAGGLRARLRRDRADAAGRAHHAGGDRDVARSGRRSWTSRSSTGCRRRSISAATWRPAGSCPTRRASR